MSDVTAEAVERYTNARWAQTVSDLTRDVGVLEAHAAQLTVENQRLDQQVRRLEAEVAASKQTTTRDTAWGTEERAQ